MGRQFGKCTRRRPPHRRNIRRSSAGLPEQSIAAPSAIPDRGLDFEQTVGAIERQILEEALRKTHGNKSAAAGMLGLKRTTLAAKLRSLGAAAGS